MPAQKRSRDSTSPPPSPPDAEKGDDSPLGSENHSPEQPQDVSGARLIVFTSTDMHYIDTLNFEFYSAFPVPDFVVVFCLFS